MQKITLTAVLLSFLQTSSAAEALLTGEGEVSAAPDYVELSIFIDSKCYPTAGDARKVNDEATREIVDFLNSKIKNPTNYSRVISTGGYTSPYQTYYQDRYLCRNTFQKQNVIIFRTQDLNNFESLFNEIQNNIYSKFSASSPSVIESSISYVTMSSAIPGISEELQNQLEQKALSIAYNNAKSKLQAMFGDEIRNLKLIEVSEIPPSEPKPFFQPLRASMTMADSRMEKTAAPAPIQLEKQTIQKTVYFRFSFDDISIK